ncbi:MAG TPA: ABC transporter permease, partial [Vicinamibacteria bacterium]|nr:ABC transporter permease [Vicinamibacteria bacterium]
WQDLRFALRTLMRAPAFTAAAVATLALGIGANSAIFTLVDATLLKRLPVREAERLVHVQYERGNVLSYPEYEDLRDHNRVFDGLAAWGGITATLGREGETDLVTGVIVTGNYFDVLGVRAGQGRLLSPGDDLKPGAHPVAVISHAFWKGRFAGRGDIVGHEVRLNGTPFTIVGVAPPGFGGSQLGVERQLYVPMMMQAVMRPPRAGYSGEMDPDLLRMRTNRWLAGLGRLKPGVTEEQARANLLSVIVATPSAAPAGTPQRALVTIPVNVGDPNLRGRLRSAATLLLAVVGAVLLLACANVANLLLSRATARRREISIRLALGASRWRLVRQLLTESVLLAALGGLAGLLLATWITQALRAATPPPGAIPIVIAPSVSMSVLAFTALISLLAGIVFGLAPALAATRENLVPTLKDESFVPDERSRRLNLKSALVVAQVGLSLVLLVTAGLFLRSLREAQHIQPGFDVHRLLAAQLPVNLLRYTRAQGRAFYDRVVERAQALPGVESATVARVPVLSNTARVVSLNLPGRQGAADRFRSEGGTTQQGLDSVSANVVGPAYFRTLGVPVLAGRDFDTRDAEKAPPVVIVNASFARAHFPGRPLAQVVGERVSFDGPNGPWREVVAVVGDSKYRALTEGDIPILYAPLSQNHETGMVLYVRTSGDPAALAGAVRREVQSLEPNLALPDLRTLEETVASSLWVPRMGALLLAGFAALALLLAAVGVYGVTSFGVAQRTREIGVRMALGARAPDVVRLVVKDGMRLVAIGLVLGLALALGAGRSLESLLYGVKGRDGLTFIVVSVVLAAVALAACLVPARRATRMDPLAALRFR